MKKRKNNNGIFYVAISLVAVLAVCSIAVAYSMSQNVNVAGDYNYYEAEGQQAPEDISLGAQSGPDHYQRNYFYAGYQSGGDRYATSSTAATYTLVSTEFDGDKTYIDWNAGIDTTLTTMASSTMYFLGENIGSERSYWFRSATTTDATTITFAAGTGVDIQHGDSTGDDLVIDGKDIAKLTFIRKADTDVLLIMDKFTEGD